MTLKTPKKLISVNKAFLMDCEGDKLGIKVLKDFRYEHFDLKRITSKSKLLYCIPDKFFATDAQIGKINSKVFFGEKK